MASPSIMQRYICMNVTQKPFDNPKVREALNYAINRPALVKVAFAGYATPATGVVPPSIAYAQSYKPWPYDPVKARELLKEAGYPNGFNTTLWSSHNHSTAQKVLQFTQQQLAQVGIKAQVTAMDAGQRAAGLEFAREIRVGNNVWFGAGVTVLPGVTIGDNTVIGAGSIVNKDIPAIVVAAGNPCRVVREITEQDGQFWEERGNGFLPREGEK